MIKGKFVVEKQRPNTFDIPGRARLALMNMLEMSDKKYGCIPYIGASIGEDKPHFVHHRLDATEVLPYSILGISAARRLSGDDRDMWISNEQRKTLLSLFSPTDGLVYTVPSPWYSSDYYNMSLWEQARIIYALIYLYLEEEDSELMAIMLGMTDSLYALTRREGSRRFFPDKIIFESVMGHWAAGSLIEPLMKLHELTGYPKALELARGIFHDYIDPSSGFFAEDGSAIKSYFRAMTGVINGISCFASYSGDSKLLARAKQIHDLTISYCTSYGSTPCREPACTGMELNVSAMSLIRAGYEDYYDQIERFTRNQITQAQFLDVNEWVESKTHKGRILKPKFVYEDYPPELEILPYDDYDNIVNRCVGGFMWCDADERSFMPASVMLCCSAHGMRSYELMWDLALTKKTGVISINYLINMENNLGEIISWEPYEGRAHVSFKTSADQVRVRVPEYMMGKQMTVLHNGTIRETTREGRYLLCGQVKAKDELTITTPLCERITNEIQYTIPEDTYDVVPDRVVKAVWRGNTVTRLLPGADSQKRLYKEIEPLKEHTVNYFIPDVRTDW